MNRDGLLVECNWKTENRRYGNNKCCQGVQYTNAGVSGQQQQQDCQWQNFILSNNQSETLKKWRQNENRSSRMARRRKAQNNVWHFYALRYCSLAPPAYHRTVVIVNAATKALIPTLNRLAQLPRKCENNKVFCFCCYCCLPQLNSTQEGNRLTN